MKQIYMLPMILLMFICIGCTKKSPPLPTEIEEGGEIIQVDNIFISMNDGLSQEKSNKKGEVSLGLGEGDVVYVNSPEGLRMREKPDINGERIFLLEDGHEVKIITVDPGNVVIDGIEGHWVYIETYKLKKWVLGRPPAYAYEKAMVESNDIEGWVFSGYLTETKKEYEVKKVTPEEKLEQFAVRYGGMILYRGNMNTVELQAHKEDMFSHLHELSDDCFEKLKLLSIYFGELHTVIPSLDERLILNSIDFNRVGLENIDALAKTNVKSLWLNSNPLTSIAVLSNNSYIEELSLSGCTNLKSLPDMSGMKKLSKLSLNGTGITTLNNIDTISHPFAIHLIDCNELIDIDALRRSNVRYLYVDRKGYGTLSEYQEGTYDKFSKWFEQYLPELKQKDGFQIIYGYDGHD